MKDAIRRSTSSNLLTVLYPPPSRSPSMSTERDPLLPKPTPDDAKQRVGPLEISAATRRWILAGMWLGTFLGALNLTLVPTMMPAISSEFQKFHQASWLGTANFLASCTFTPLYGRLCNVLGRRRAYQLAIVLTGAGAVGCGLAQSMEGLIAARFIAGMGGGGVFTASTIIVSDMYSLRERGLVQALASVFNSFGMGLGGPIGGLITDLWGWRAAFLMQIPLFVASAVITQVNVNYVTDSETKSKSTKAILKRIDYFGSLSLLTFVGAFVLFLSSRYNESLPWLNPLVLVPLVISAVFMVIFVVVELFVAPEPVMPMSLLQQKIPVLVGASNFFANACIFSVTYFFPLWFQVVKLQSASTAGLHLMPNSVSLSLGSIFAGWMMHKTGRYKTINAIFGAFPFFGAIFIASLREDSGWVQSWLSIVPFGFGNAVVLQTLLIALLAHLPQSQMAVGTGFGQLFRGLGQVGGVAMASAVFQAQLDSELRRRFPPGSDELIMNIRRSSGFLRQLGPEDRRLARDAYALSLKAVYALAAVSTLLAYIVRMPIPDQDLDKAHDKKPEVPPEQIVPAPEPLPGDVIAGEAAGARPGRSVEGRV
ncbi:Vacuolar amino acid permease [Mycena indigotica]|uniref:Vacuolar amino acid permease n=1 Tax=Mycena indigotica TaxID=2126181 RepID=A0A8H6TDZ8_9AGAR|nr:Vacuolar amino acid permease [Mycena indigotica]KAF7314937.1 Vacuolar amino acid permease [Mycena indigotica]